MGITTLFVSAVLVAIAMNAEAALPLPSFIKACSRNDPKLNECALARGKPVIFRLKDGLPKYRIPKLEPFRISEIKINREKGASSGVGVDLVAKDVVVRGLSSSKLQDLKVRVNPPNFLCKVLIPRLELLSQYEIDGRILILPIRGNGDSNITLVNLEVIYEFGGDWLMKSDGKEYMDIKKSTLKFNSSRTHINLTNLFNGDNELGKRMNEFLDSNWREVTEEMGPPIAEALAEVIRSIVRGVTDQVPFEYIFPEKI